MNKNSGGEFDLIAQLGANLKTRGGVKFSLGDDCAHLSSLQAPVITVDALVENVHFRLDWLEKYASPQTLGWKTLAVSVSDLASSGAFPVAAFVALGVPRGADFVFAQAVYEGMEHCAESFNFTVAGGDTTKSPVWTLTATLVGELMPEAQGKPVLRNGAREGDFVCVTRNLGESGTALEMMKRGQKPPSSLLKAHLSPMPETEIMRELLRHNRENIHAALDLSDGLGGDAIHIARESGVRLEIDCEKLPLSPRAKEAARELELDPINFALGGGEDYALLICCEKIGPGLIEIGRVTRGEGVIFRENGRERGVETGWRHF